MEIGITQFIPMLYSKCYFGVSPNELLGSIGEYRSGYYLIRNSLTEASKVQLEENRQVCKIHSERSARNINFGVILYNYIRKAQRLDASRRLDSAEVDRFESDLLEIYESEKRRNPTIQYSPKQYLLALIQSGKRILPDHDPVWKFVQDL